MNGPPRIENMYAYLVMEDDGTETVPVVPALDERVPGQVMSLYMPLVAAGLPRMTAMRRHLFHLPHLRGKTVQLVRFARQEVLDTITLTGDGDNT